MNIKFGSWQLTVEQPQMDTSALMAIYSRRASRWKKVVQRYGVDRSYSKLWQLMPIRFEIKSRVLDIGAGTGTLAKSFKQNYPQSNITLLDLNTEMLDQAVRDLSFPVEIIHANAASYRSKGQVYDVVICAHVIEHMEDPVSTLRHWQSCFHEDSYIVLIVTRKKWFNSWLNLSWNLNLYHEDELLRKFKLAGYEVCHTLHLPGIVAGKLSRVYVARRQAGLK